MESSLPSHVAQAELLLDYVLSVRRMENERDHPHEFVPGSFRLGIAALLVRVRVRSARLWEPS